jgi:hypothetical protein
VDVPAGVTRLVDVARVPPSPPHELWKDKLELLVTPQPNDQRHLLKRGEYDLALTLSAHNADARHYEMTVRFDPEATPTLAVTDPRVIGEIVSPPVAEE